MIGCEPGTGSGICITDAERSGLDMDNGESERATPWFMIGCEFGTGLGTGLGKGLGTRFDKPELMGSGTFPVDSIGCAGFCP